ncbi:unnamed protein product [Cuscuta europaea]|uniref:Reverse transcriptase Ty1/copia-type domain-containing protein n=1 Tax=Cuscuta europaea TaxID=41803 RepID=A0A9P0Z6I9_CUSEU|nr:unnamed protein product [Cuscuta europaea]
MFIHKLTTRFSIKDLGHLHHFLGIEVIPSSRGIFLSQRQYILNILDTFKMTGAKESSTPMTSAALTSGPSDCPMLDPKLYRRVLGLLQYLAFTRPDISFVVNRLSQHMHCPSDHHWQAVKRVLRYLKGTINFGLFLHRNCPLQLTAFSDSSWGNVSDAGHSTTGYVLYLGPNIISWKSAKQKCVSRSSTEAEYQAVANTTAELLWAQNILRELGIQLPTKPVLYCDNLGATYVCVNPVFHSRMKHLALDYFFVRELVEQGALRVQHISTKLQIADILTKPLGRDLFEKFRLKLGVSKGTSILWGRNNT